MEDAVGTAADFALGVVWVPRVGESGHYGGDDSGRELHDDGGEGWVGGVGECGVDGLEAG